MHFMFHYLIARISMLLLLPPAGSNSRLNDTDTANTTDSGLQTCGTKSLYGSD